MKSTITLKGHDPRNPATRVEITVTVFAKADGYGEQGYRHLSGPYDLADPADQQALLGAQLNLFADAKRKAVLIDGRDAEHHDKWAQVSARRMTRPVCLWATGLMDQADVINSNYRGEAAAPDLNRRPCAA